MHLPVPPVVDFATAVNENWHGAFPALSKKLLHIGVIVAKTGHDRGQKEMYLYSPTVKRHDGRIVCSNDFLNFEVGDWILFHVIVDSNGQEVYFGGKKFNTPLYKTAIQFDSPKVKVRACIYPESAFNALVSRQQTHRCWSPDLGDLFIENGKSMRYGNAVEIQKMHTFLRDPTRLYYVVVDYHFNASVFHDLGGPDEEKKVYWRIDSVENVVEDPKDVPDFARAPWGREVAKYLETKREVQNNYSNGVPPWYIRSTKVLTFNMLETWEEEVKACYGQNDEKDHPVPAIYKDDGTRRVAHPSDIFAELKTEQKQREVATSICHDQSTLKSKHSWKQVMSFDGKMLEPGSQLPPVSVKKQKSAGKVELVQDSAGLFMNEAAAQSYVDIKNSGTDKLWTTGGWKKPGEAWVPGAVQARGDRSISRIDQITTIRKDLIHCEPVTVQSKNLLGIKKAPPKKPVETKESLPTSAERASRPPSHDRPRRVSTGQTPPSSPIRQFSFATASKNLSDRDSMDDFSDEAEREINPSKLNTEGRKIYEKYMRLKEYVRKMDIEAKKKASIKGFTALEFIETHKVLIKWNHYMVKVGIKDAVTAKEERDLHVEIITDMERRLETGDVLESELVDIYLSKEDDAEAQEDFIAHVEIQKREMGKMKKQLIEIQYRESTC